MKSGGFVSVATAALVATIAGVGGTLPVVLVHSAQQRLALHVDEVLGNQEVVVKNLAAVQNFGGMNILCTDKTGTLTQDRIELVKCVDATGEDSKEVLLYAYLSSVFHTARKSPLDTAIQVHGKMDTHAYAKVDEIPFDFERRRDSVVVSHGTTRMMIAKGAPESIASVSTKFQEASGKVVTMTDELKKKLEEAGAKADIK